MKRLFKYEFVKATKNKLFIISVIIGLLICLYSAVYTIESYYTELDNCEIIRQQSDCLINPMNASFSLFNRWIGQEWISVASSLFFLLCPLLATIPYSWSFSVEKKNGYINNIFIRTNKSRYVNVKFIVTFLTGGLCALIPIMVNLMVVSAFIPAVKPDVFYDIYYNMPVSNAFSQLFYEMPVVYILLKVIIIALFSGCYAVMGQATGFIIKNKFIAILLPFVFMMLYNYISNVFSPTVELSPIQYLYGGGDVLTDFRIVIVQMFIIGFVSYAVMRIKGEVKDVL